MKEQEQRPDFGIAIDRHFLKLETSEEELSRISTRISKELSRYTDQVESLSSILRQNKSEALSLHKDIKEIKEAWFSTTAHLDKINSDIEDFTIQSKRFLITNIPTCSRILYDDDLVMYVRTSYDECITYLEKGAWTEDLKRLFATIHANIDIMAAQRSLQKKKAELQALEEKIQEEIKYAKTRATSIRKMM